ncbi:Elongation of fatty acids protein 2, variant 2 [Perkinsus olseni]|uniref:Flap endonuclease 1 n=1 Tax=Perkinsus olseni TaxID=32597 RepID=A0A7J6R5X0_PEROL|nr:Elongation of fatty acids protein 2, variant 2 [Perkinsus olseni]
MQIIRMAAWCGEETRLAALEKDWCVPYGGSAITESLAAMVVYTVIWSRSRRLRKSRGVRFYPHAQGVMILSSLAMLLGTLYISGSYFPVFWLDLMCLDVFCYLIRYAVGCWLLWLCVSFSAGTLIRECSDEEEGPGIELGYSDGSKYIGDIVDGQREGEGRWEYPGGYYQGMWLKNEPHGEGVQTWADGRIYVGTFKEGKFHGAGRMEWHVAGHRGGPMVYQGQYVEDRKEGYGTFEWPDGRKYAGWWLAGKRHGDGEYTTEFGQTRKGIWENDVLVRWVGSVGGSTPSGSAGAGVGPVRVSKNLEVEQSASLLLTSMGIKQLFKFVSENAPKSVSEQKMENYTGRSLALDASMCLYQFLIAVRLGGDNQHVNLTNAAGDVTSHISGFVTRTLRMMEAGIKPVYVFDGKPPSLKTGELEKRREIKKKAEEDLKEAIEKGDDEGIRKAAHRSTRVTPKMNADVKKLLTMMGCCIVEAPEEAEASCAALVKYGKCYGAVTDDMDVLTFGSPVQIKNLFNTLGSGQQHSAGKSTKPVYEMSLSVVLEQLDVTMDQFVDFCIMCGCDYLDTIRGIGPNNAFKLIVEHKNIEGVLEHIDKSKFTVPDSWINGDYKKVREYFLEAPVVERENVELKWPTPDYDGLKKFLVDENQFSEDRVDKYISRLRKCKQAKTQMRLDTFFKTSKPAIKKEDKFDPFKKETKKNGVSTGGRKRASASTGGAKAKKVKK